MLRISITFLPALARIFKKKKKKIFRTKKHLPNYLKDPISDTFFISPTATEEVYKSIQELQVNKSPGPNSIPTKILKLAKENLSRPLPELINKSFLSGVFPNVFKIAKVVSVFKAESRILCSNYRPISLLSNIGKIIEKLMHKRLNVFLEKKQIYCNFQFGFRPSFSTNNALLSIAESIQSHIEKNKFCTGAFFDLKQAFDTVDHPILLQKLEHYGISGVANEWFSSNLKNRAQFDSIGNVSSTIKELLTGVSQGSVLGPLFFLLYINDLRNSVKYAKTYRLADDTSEILSSTSLEILSKRINKDLFNLSNWLKANKQSLNVKKTGLVIFRSRKIKIDSSFKFKLDGKRLVPTKSVKYLGVLYDELLHWNEHI